LGKPLFAQEYFFCMFKKFLLIFNVVFLFLILLFFNFKKEFTDLNLEKLKNQLEKHPNYKILKHSCIDHINNFNSKITTFSSGDCFVDFFQNKLKFKCCIDYKKNLNFHMKIYSFLGKELDLGSNEEIFWYWSKRDSPPIVYWSSHRDFIKTRLKDPFNPIFIKSTLCLDEIDTTGATIFEDQNNLMISKKQLNSLNQYVNFSILIDKNKKQISGFVLSDVGGDILVECQIVSRIDNVPQEIIYYWKKENKKMRLFIEKYQINQNTKNVFEMPDGKRINMAED
jgi:hypothetical protein